MIFFCKQFVILRAFYLLTLTLYHCVSSAYIFIFRQSLLKYVGHSWEGYILYSIAISNKVYQRAGYRILSFTSYALHCLIVLPIKLARYYPYRLGGSTDFTQFYKGLTCKFTLPMAKTYHLKFSKLSSHNIIYLKIILTKTF